MLARHRPFRTTVTAALSALGLAGVGACLGLAPSALVPPADAATCGAAGGVSVVVDNRELGGGITTSCASDGGGRTASAIFASVGVGLSYATRQPGFVCRVNGVPASDPCLNTSPADAYWGLWWADGSTASWTYSSSGVGSLVVPAGGSVAFTWQQDRAASGAVPPGVAAPIAPVATPTATATTSPPSSSTPSGSAGGSTSGPSQGGGSTGGGSGGGSSQGGSGSRGGSSPSPSSSPSSSASSSPSATSRPSGASPEAGTSASPEAGASPSAGAGRERGRTGAGRDRASDPTQDATASEGPAATEAPTETPTEPPAEAADTDQPGRIPTSVTLGVIGALGVAAAGATLLARRRRGA